MKKSRKAAVREADKWFSMYIRALTSQEVGHCAFCNKPVEHCFHFFSRANYATRWDELNAIGSCAGCNYRMEFEPYPFYKWFAEQYGQFSLDELNRKHHTIGKFSTQEILDIAEKFKNLYNGLKK